MLKKPKIGHLFILLSLTLLLLSACIPTVNQVQQPQTPTISQQLQKQLTPIPTIPAYRCGAWASPNTPAAYSSILIHARLTKQSANGLVGITAQATVHFKSGDMPLPDQPTSDTDGYVTFTLFLAGRQPPLTPATIDITFNTPGNPTTCTAFFTPQ